MTMPTTEPPSRKLSHVPKAKHNLLKNRSTALNGGRSEASAVVVVDSRVLIRECLATCLRASLGQLVRSYGSLSEWAHDIADETLTALILVCLDGRRTMDEQIEQIDRERGKFAAEFTLPPIVFISDEEENIGEIVIAIDSGAKGYIPTSLTLEIAVEALKLVQAGGVFVPASCLLSAKRMLKSISKEQKLPLAGMFTQRQATVLEAICQGKANKMIAYELSMHESTVKVHVRTIMKKLNAQNRTQVAYLTHHLFHNTGV